MKAAVVVVVLLLLVIQSAVAFNLVAAEQSNPKLNAYLKMFGSENGFVNETAWPYPESWHWEFHMRVDYNASDGSHPQVSILWTDDVGGTFLPSPTSQEVHWRSPPKIICFIINVTVSALGYESGSGSAAAVNFDIPVPSGGYVQPNAQNCPYLFPSGNGSVSTATTVIPPPTNPQTSNATLEYDLTNRLTENGTTCTYEWGPKFVLYRTPDEFRFNFSSTNPIDVYVFDSDYYRGAVSCTLGPMLHPPYAPFKLTGTQDTFATACLGCAMEGGKGSFSYVLFLNHDPSVTPHVILEVALKLHAATTTTTVSSPPSAVPYIGVPETLIAIILGFFLLARLRRRRD